MSSPDDDLRRAAERYKFEIDRHRSFHIEALNNLIIEGDKKQELLIECEKKQELIDKLHIDIDSLKAQQIVDGQKRAAQTSEIDDLLLRGRKLAKIAEESGTLLANWQHWWSGTMRPAVARLTQAAALFPVGPPVVNTANGTKHEGA